MEIGDKVVTIKDVNYFSSSSYISISVGSIGILREITENKPGHRVDVDIGDNKRLLVSFHLSEIESLEEYFYNDFREKMSERLG